MIVNLYDAKNQNLIWRGLAQDTLSNKGNKNQEMVEKAVGKMFKAVTEMIVQARTAQRRTQKAGPLMTADRRKLAVSLIAVNACNPPNCKSNLQSTPKTVSNNVIIFGACLFVASCLLATIALGQTVRHGTHTLPRGVMEAMWSSEKDYCEQGRGTPGSDCHKKFGQNLRWEKVVITPAGDIAILIENRNTDYCGSGGCSLLMFVAASSGHFAQVFDEIGDLARIRVLDTMTRGHFDLRKTWADGHTKTIYKWNGNLYSAAS